MIGGRRSCLTLFVRPKARGYGSLRSQGRPRGGRLLARLRQQRQLPRLRLVPGCDLSGGWDRPPVKQWSANFGLRGSRPGSPMARYMPSTDRKRQPCRPPISSPHLFEVMRRRKQAAAVRQIDAVIIGMNDRRRGEAEVDLPGAGVAHHANDLFRGGAAHQRIVDQDDALCLRSRARFALCFMRHAEVSRTLWVG